MVSRQILIIAGLLFLTTSVIQAASLKSRLDRNEVTRWQTLNLTVSLDQQVITGEPDFSQLEKDFEIVNRNRQSRYSNANGKKLSLTQWTLTLLPKREGTLIIPSFNFKGQVSDALEVNVQKQTATVDTHVPIFTEIIVSKNTVYVQQQTLLTLRLYTTLSLNNFAMSTLTIADAQVIKLAESHYRKLINGKDYTVVETSLAIFAEKSGQLVIPPVHYSGVIELNPAGNFWRNRRGKRITVSTEEKTLTIKARPASASTTDWLPASELILYSSWNSKNPVFRVGEPVTRTIVQTANGLASNQLPPLPIHQQQGEDKSFKLYADKPQLEDNKGVAGITGSRIESMAIVPGITGTLILPEMRVQWWDVGKDEMQVAVLASESYQVLPALEEPTSRSDPVTGQTIAPKTVNTERSARPGNSWSMTILLISNMIFALLVLVFGVLWWRLSKLKSAGSSKTNTEFALGNSLFKPVRVAAATHDFAKLREAIILWARGHWRDESIHTLSQVASKLHNSHLANIFQQLDHYLYAKHGKDAEQPTLEGLIEQLEKNHRKPPQEKHMQSKKLLPLYPNPGKS